MTHKNQPKKLGEAPRLDPSNALASVRGLWKRSKDLVRTDEPKAAEIIPKIDKLKSFADHGDLWSKYLLARYYVYSRKEEYVKQGIDYLMAATTLGGRTPNGTLASFHPASLTPETAWILMVGRKFMHLSARSKAIDRSLSLMPDVYQTLDAKIQERYHTDMSPHHLIGYHQKHASLLNAFLALPARDQKAMISAHRLLGDLCREGVIVDRNVEIAHKHLLTAAYLGDQQAKFHFASSHVAGLWKGLETSRIPNPTRRQIRRWLIRGFSKKNLNATFSLGYALHHGIGIEADMRQAVRIYNHYFVLERDIKERQKKGERFGALRRKVHRLHGRHFTPT